MIDQLLTRWQKLSVQQRRLTVAVGSIVGLWLVYIVGVRPLWVQLEHVRGEVEETEERLRRAIALTAQSDPIRRAYEVYRPYIPAKQPGAAPLDVTKIQSHVQSAVEAAVRASGMSLLTVKPARGGAGTRIVSVAMEAEATSEQLIRLLDYIQRSNDLLRVSRLVLRVVDEESSTLRCSLVISKLLL